MSRARCAPTALRVAIAVATAGAGCADDPPLVIGAVTPPYGPLVGGTVVRLTGHGLDDGPPGATEVLIDGRAAPLAHPLGDGALDLVVPPGTSPGDAEVVVLIGDRNARARGVFRYAAAPTITGVGPADVLHDAWTTITVTGAGFAADGAGEPHLAIDGQGVEVRAVSDTELTFLAPPGRALAEPDLELVNDRGRATWARGFRYLPGPNPGLLLFPGFDEFAIFFDPATRTVVDIPWAAPVQNRFTAVVRDRDGRYWAVDRSRRIGRLDLATQQLAGAVTSGRWFPAMARVGDEFVAIDRASLRFATVQLPFGAVTPITGPTLPCCGSHALAANGGQLYFTAASGSGSTIATFELATRTAGPAVPLLAPEGFRVEEMHFFAGTLYAVDPTGAMITIDPATGATAEVPLPQPVFLRAHAMEVFDPAAPH